MTPQVKVSFDKFNEITSESMLNIIKQGVVTVSQVNSKVVLNSDNSSISSSRASRPLVSENPGKLAIPPSGAICTLCYLKMSSLEWI